MREVDLTLTIKATVPFDDFKCFDEALTEARDDFVELVAQKAVEEIYEGRRGLEPREKRRVVVIETDGTVIPSRQGKGPKWRISVQKGPGATNVE